jgi:hypothetical protein
VADGFFQGGEYKMMHSCPGCGGPTSIINFLCAQCRKLNSEKKHSPPPEKGQDLSGVLFNILASISVGIVVWQVLLILLKR